MHSEISLDRTFKQLVSLYYEENDNSNGSLGSNPLVLVQQTLDNDEMFIQRDVYINLMNQLLYNIYNIILYEDSYNNNRDLLAQDQIIQTYLDMMASLTLKVESPSKYFLDSIQFSVFKVQAVKYYKRDLWENAIKYLNAAIKNYPRSTLSDSTSVIAGLAEALVMLTKSYSAIGKKDDALHSARLAVDISHKGLEAFQKKNKQSFTNSDMDSDKLTIGPVLEATQAMVLTYYSLATELNKSGLNHLSLEWYERALQVAEKFNMNGSTIAYLENLIKSSHYNNEKVQLSHPVVQIIDTSFDDNGLIWDDNFDEIIVPLVNDNNSNNNSNNELLVGSSFIPSKIDINPNQPLSNGYNLASPTAQSKQQESNNNSLHDVHYGQGITSLPTPTSGALKVRPRSALPRLIQDNNMNLVLASDSNSSTNSDNNKNSHGYDGYYLTDNKSGNGGLGGSNHLNRIQNHIPYYSNGNNQMSLNELNDDNFDNQRIRPKSAISKLGGAYLSPKLQNNNRTFFDNSNDNNTIVDSPTSPHKTEDNNFTSNYSSQMDDNIGKNDQSKATTSQPEQKTIANNDLNESAKIKVEKSAIKYQHQERSIIMLPPGAKKRSKSSSNNKSKQLNNSNSSNQLDPLSDSFSKNNMKDKISSADYFREKVFELSELIKREYGDTSPAKHKIKSQSVNGVKDDVSNNVKEDISHRNGFAARSIRDRDLERINVMQREAYGVMASSTNLKNTPHLEAAFKPLPRPKSADFNDSSYDHSDKKGNNGLKNSQSVGISRTATLDSQMSRPVSSRPDSSNQGKPLQVNDLVTEETKGKILTLAKSYFPFIKGTKIEAKYLSTRLGLRSKWMPGHIINANFLNGQYDIEYDNGIIESNVNVDNIRLYDYAKVAKRNTKINNAYAEKSNNNDINSNGKKIPQGNERNMFHSKTAPTLTPLSDPLKELLKDIQRESLKENVLLKLEKNKTSKNEEFMMKTSNESGMNKKSLVEKRRNENKIMDENNSEFSFNYSANLLRKKFNNEMHFSIERIFGQVTSRESIRKQERIFFKSISITKIQKIIRGFICRKTFQKKYYNLKKSYELRKREIALQTRESQLLQSMNLMMDKLREQAIIEARNELKNLVPVPVEKLNIENMTDTNNEKVSPHLSYNNHMLERDPIIYQNQQIIQQNTISLNAIQSELHALQVEQSNLFGLEKLRQRELETKYDLLHNEVTKNRDEFKNMLQEYELQRNENSYNNNSLENYLNGFKHNFWQNRMIRNDDNNHHHFLLNQNERDQLSSIDHFWYDDSKVNSMNKPRPYLQIQDMHQPNGVDNYSNYQNELLFDPVSNPTSTQQHIMNSDVDPSHNNDIILSPILNNNNNNNNNQVLNVNLQNNEILDVNQLDNNAIISNSNTQNYDVFHNGSSLVQDDSQQEEEQVVVLFSEKDDIPYDNIVMSFQDQGLGHNNHFSRMEDHLLTVTPVAQAQSSISHSQAPSIFGDGVVTINEDSLIGINISIPDETTHYRHPQGQYSQPESIQVMNNYDNLPLTQPFSLESPDNSLQYSRQPSVTSSINSFKMIPFHNNEENKVDSKFHNEDTPLFDDDILDDPQMLERLMSNPNFDVDGIALSDRNQDNHAAIDEPMIFAEISHGNIEEPSTNNNSHFSENDYIIFDNTYSNTNNDHDDIRSTQFNYELPLHLNEDNLHIMDPIKSQFQPNNISTEIIEDNNKQVQATPVDDTSDNSNHHKDDQASFHVKSLESNHNKFDKIIGLKYKIEMVDNKEEVVIASVDHNSWGDKNGIEVGDVVEKVNDVPIKSFAMFYDLITSPSIDKEPITLSIRKTSDGKMFSIKTPRFESMSKQEKDDKVDSNPVIDHQGDYQTDSMDHNHDNSTNKEEPRIDHNINITNDDINDNTANDIKNDNLNVNHSAPNHNKFDKIIGLKYKIEMVDNKEEVVIASVDHNSWGDKNGVEVGDVVEKVNNVLIKSFAMFYDLITSPSIDKEPITLSLRKGSDGISFSIKTPRFENNIQSNNDKSESHPIRDHIKEVREENKNNNDHTTHNDARYDPNDHVVVTHEVTKDDIDNAHVKDDHPVNEPSTVSNNNIVNDHVNMMHNNSLNDLNHSHSQSHTQIDDLSNKIAEREAGENHNNNNNDRNDNIINSLPNNDDNLHMVSNGFISANDNNDNKKDDHSDKENSINHDYSLSDDKQETPSSSHPYLDNKNNNDNNNLDVKAIEEDNLIVTHDDLTSILPEKPPRSPYILFEGNQLESLFELTPAKPMHSNNNNNNNNNDNVDVSLADDHIAQDTSFVFSLDGEGSLTFSGDYSEKMNDYSYTGTGVSAAARKGSTELIITTDDPLTGVMFHQDNVNDEDVVMVAFVAPNSIADKQGVKAGDIVSSINHQKVTSLDRFYELIVESPLEIRIFTLGIVAVTMIAEQTEGKHDNIWSAGANIYSSKISIFPGFFSKPASELILNILHKFNNPISVLDIAAGNGAFTLALISCLLEQNNDDVVLKNWNFHVTDFAVGMVDEAKSNFASFSLDKKISDISITFEVMNGQNLEYEDNSISIVGCMFGIMFYPNRTKGLSEIQRVLKSDGCAVISCWNYSEVAYVSTAFANFLGKTNLQGINKLVEISSVCSNPIEFQDELAVIGFRSVNISRHSHEFVLPNNEDTFTVIAWLPHAKDIFVEEDGSPTPFEILFKSWQEFIYSPHGSKWHKIEDDTIHFNFIANIAFVMK
eukprot:gene4514-6378_t